MFYDDNKINNLKQTFENLQNQEISRKRMAKKVNFEIL